MFVHCVVGDACAVIDSVKTASDLISPVTGVVRDINEDLVSDPSLLGTDPEGTGELQSGRSVHTACLLTLSCLQP